MLYDAGVDIKSAQKFLGHANIEMTLSVYTHLTKFKIDSAIESLNTHIAEMGYSGSAEDDDWKHNHALKALVKAKGFYSAFSSKRLNKWLY